MSAVRVRTPGNNPETRIVCDAYCSRYASDWDARAARKRAREHGWVRVEGKDYCPDHAPAD